MFEKKAYMDKILQSLMPTLETNVFKWLPLHLYYNICISNVSKMEKVSELKKKPFS